jgi:valyl-tRNA synthetase
VISAIRNIRGENRISPAVKINVRIGITDGESQKILGNNRSAIMTMGRIENLDIGEEGSLSKCAVTQIIVGYFKVKVIIPLEGLVDIEEEVKRIEKTIEKLNKDIASISGRLNNENFVKNAAEDVVEADRKTLDQSKVQEISLRESLLRLKS